MSHFKVLVIGPDWEEQLAPYEEGSTFFETADGSRAKWDWYALGGRWTGSFVLKDAKVPALVGEPGLMTDPAKPGTADQARKGDIDFAASEWMPFAVVREGVWSQKGEMGWFGMSTEEVPEDAWQAEISSAVLNLPDDTILTMVDCHI